MNQKGFGKIVWLIILFVLAIGATAYLLISRKSHDIGSYTLKDQEAEAVFPADVYVSQPFIGGRFEVTLPKDWTYVEHPDDLAIVGFLPKGVTAMEGVGGKVYRYDTPSKTFAAFQKEIRDRDLCLGEGPYCGGFKNITYKTASIGGYQTIIATGYPGIVDTSSSLYVFTGKGWYFRFDDPPQFVMDTLKKIE